MPFQVASSSFRNIVGEITLVTAGDDQTDICSPVVFLVATIIGSPIGHTFEWEQQTGPAITIDDPSAISTFYNAGATGDKIFRFYIDRGTASEQFDDVTIFDTPITMVGSFGVPDTGEGVSAGVRQPIISPVTTINGNIVNTPDSPPAQLHGEATVNQVFTLTWSHPGQANDSYITQYNVLEALVEVANVPAIALLPTATGTASLGPPSDLKSYNLGAITSYQVNTKYNFHGVEREVNSAIVDFTGTPVEPVIAIDDAYDGGMSVPNAGVGVSVGITRFTNEVLQVPNDVVTSGWSTTDATIVSITRFSSELLQVPNDVVNSGWSTTNGRSVSFTRFDPSGIGGGGG